MATKLPCCMALAFAFAPLCSLAGGAGADVRILRASASTHAIVAGDHLTYTVFAFNAGPNSASNMQINLTTPAGTQLVSFAGAATELCTAPPLGSAGTVSCTWTFPSFSLLATRLMRVVIAVPADTPSGTHLMADVSVSAAESDPNSSNNNVQLASFVSNVAAGSAQSVPTTQGRTLFLLGILIGMMGVVAARNRIDVN